jgi:hypothetical protein
MLNQNAYFIRSYRCIVFYLFMTATTIWKPGLKQQCCMQRAYNFSCTVCNWRCVWLRDKIKT